MYCKLVATIMYMWPIIYHRNTYLMKQVLDKINVVLLTIHFPKLCSENASIISIQEFTCLLAKKFKFKLHFQILKGS